MSDLRDEVFSDDFPAYRMKEIEVAVEFVAAMQLNGIEYTRGALDMFKKILNIPVALAKTKEQKEYIGRRLKEDMARFEVEYLRRAVHSE
jgi:hypothetical protein